VKTPFPPKPPLVPDYLLDRGTASLVSAYLFAFSLSGGMAMWAVYTDSRVILAVNCGALAINLMSGADFASWVFKAIWLQVRMRRVWEQLRAVHERQQRGGS